MSNTQTALRGWGSGISKEQTKNIPVVNKEFFIIRDGLFDYYFIDFDRVEFESAGDILGQCRDIEDEIWNAKEDFFNYAKKCSALLYVAKGDKIVGFLLVTSWFLDDNYVFTLNEGMVIKKYQSNQAAFKMTLMAVRVFYKRVTQLKSLKRFTLTIETSNPRLMSLFHTYKYYFGVLDNSFKPSANLLKIINAFVKNNNCSFLDEQNPFFLKERFNSCNKYDTNNRNFAFSEGLKKILPSGFDPIHRGDSFVLMITGSKNQIWPPLNILSLLLLGKGILTNSKFGFFKKDKDFLGIELSGVNKPRP